MNFCRYSFINSHQIWNLWRGVNLQNNSLVIWLISFWTNFGNYWHEVSVQMVDSLYIRSYIHMYEFHVIRSFIKFDHKHHFYRIAIHISVQCIVWQTNYHYVSGELETDFGVRKQFLYRFKNWQDVQNALPCRGKYVRSICIFGIEDLPLLNSSPVSSTLTSKDKPFFAWMSIYNRTRDEYAQRLDFDTQHYKSLVTCNCLMGMFLSHSSGDLFV